MAMTIKCIWGGVTANKGQLYRDMKFKDCYFGGSSDVVNSGELHSKLHTVIEELKIIFINIFYGNYFLFIAKNLSQKPHMGDSTASL